MTAPAEPATLRRLAEAAPDIDRPFTAAEFERLNAFIDVVQDRRVVLALLDRLAALEGALRLVVENMGNSTWEEPSDEREAFAVLDVARAALAGTPKP